MKKILYMMHVPWGWIKQRPHFFAEYLSTDYDINIFYKYPLNVKKKHLLNQTNNSLVIKKFYQLPFYRIPIIRYSIISKLINRFILRLSINKKQFVTYDYIWITSISLFPMIKHLISSTSFLIWDCMDDELEFNNVKLNSYLLKRSKLEESELIRQAKLIFCSSEYLSKKIQERTNFSREITIVNNAVQLPINHDRLLPDDKVKKDLLFLDSLSNIFMYVGAISEWFDFEVVLKALSKNQDMYIILIGPNDIPIKEHDRIIHMGVIERKWIFHYMEKAKALIMPFIVNELVKSVNPVKLYEYIFVHKPIIVPYYQEIEKFRNYIYTYKSEEDFCDLSKKIINNILECPKSEQECKDFANNNQWINRCQLIKKYIG